jgi:CheY-like chemotaxis protein
LADRKIRILVAEDDPAFAKMLDDSLKESGSPYHLEKVSSGQECLKLLQQKKIDILVLD